LGLVSTNPTTCKKCNGTGRIPMFAHIEGGRCFACNDPRTPADKAWARECAAEAQRLNAMTTEERNVHITAKAAESIARKKAARMAARAARKAVA
jgi:hypothetical protein